MPIGQAYGRAREDGSFLMKELALAVTGPVASLNTAWPATPSARSGAFAASGVLVLIRRDGLASGLSALGVMAAVAAVFADLFPGL